MDLPGYALERLCLDGAFELFRGRGHGEDPSDPPTILVSVPTFEHPRLDYAEMLEREFSLRSELEPTWAVRPLELSRGEGRKVLILSDPGGLPLQQFIASVKPDVGVFLELAVSIVRSVGEMHRRGIVHKDLKPSHIMVDGDTGQAWLTGFRIASQIPRERQIPAPPETIAGTLAYMAPEQTGCMNRSIDSRSDLYALGVVFYEMLTATLPFSASDPISWVHCHVARKPSPPTERNTRIPAAISAIVLKLLAKSAEDRYQTAAGLERDLRVCLAQYQASKAIDVFQLATADLPARMVVPERLFGRELETGAITAAFDRVVATGVPEFVLVSGYSGIGKSAVVNELQKELLLSEGLFATGKFEQFKRDVPYFTLAQAFQRLVLALLIKTDSELMGWREALQKALDSDGALMVDLIPPLRRIVGNQPPVPELPPQDAKRRFHQTFQRFLMVFAQSEHPLTIFLDDLQWVDVATLDLLESMLADPAVQHLLVIGAYRDNEVDVTHPLLRSIDRIRSSDVAVTDISLKPLNLVNSSLLIANSLGCEAHEVTHLAELLYSKTAGNPFFLIQLLTTLPEEGLLSRDDRGMWSWDIERIAHIGFTENVIDLMLVKLTRLPSRTQEFFKTLACLGTSAPIELLRIACGKSDAELDSDLRAVVKTELIVFFEGSYRFLHDRVQEAAYLLSAGPSRAEAHLQIGRRMVQAMSAEEREGAIFEIVNQFNRAAYLIDTKEEKVQLAELNLIAGNRARASTAFTSALAYYGFGFAFISIEDRDHFRDLAFALELNLAECEFLTGDLDAAEVRLSGLKAHTVTILEYRSVACLQIDLYTTLGRTDVAIDVGLSFLRQFDQGWSKNPTEQDVASQYDKTWSLIGERTAEDLIDLPMMTDEPTLAIVDVLTRTATPALLINDNLHSLLICRTVGLSLLWGNTNASCHAYVHLGAMAGRRFGDYGSGYELGRVGYELVERGLDRFKARALLSFASLVMPWTRPFSAGRDLMRRAFDDANKLGDLTFAGYSCHNLVSNLLAAGESLVDVQRETEEFLKFAKKAGFGLVIDVLKSQHAFIATMRGNSFVFGSLDTPELTEGDFETHLAADPRSGFSSRWYWVKKLQARYFSSEYHVAVTAAENVFGALGPLASFVEVSEAHFFSALSHAAMCDQCSPAERNRHYRDLLRHHEKVSAWAKSCPENFRARSLIVGAEIARIEGREFDAQRLFEEAVQSARISDFPHDEAIANELAARLYGARGLETASVAYLRNAHQAYAKWGAYGKVRQLERQHPDLRSDQQWANVPSTTVEALVEQLDLATVIRVSQAILGETEMDHILDIVMRNAIEHAGAERALLLLATDNGLRSVAEATTEPNTIEVQLSDGPIDPLDAPEQLLTHVFHSREAVILDDALLPHPHWRDPYLRNNRVRSVMCLPLVNQGTSVGILYLENNQATRAFAPGRIAAIKVVASQAAISIDNARLYRDLARREARIRRLVDANIIGIFIWEYGGRIVEANDALLTITGYTRAEFLEGGLSWTQLVPSDLRYLDDSLFSKLNATGSLQPFESEYLRKDGSRVHVLVGVATLDDSVAQGVAYVLDLTERHAAQEALNVAHIELSHLSRVSAVGALTASITHEISQPLSGIVTNASTGLRVLDSQRPDLDVVRDTIVRTLRDGNRAKDVIERLRSLFSKGKFADELLDLNDATREIITLSASDLRRFAIELRLDLADDLPPVMGDRLQLQQVVQNIVRNAADAMAAIHDRPRQLLIRTVREADNMVGLTIRDTGIGLPVHREESLFDAFYTTKPHGMGIGLFVSKSIIERHNGRLWASSNAPSPGTTFSFSVPSKS